MSMHVSAELSDKLTRIKPMPNERGGYSRFRQTSSIMLRDRIDQSERILYYNNPLIKHSDAEGLLRYFKHENCIIALEYLQYQFDSKRVFVAEKLKQFRSFTFYTQSSISHRDFLLHF